MTTTIIKLAVYQKRQEGTRNRAKVSTNQWSYLTSPMLLLISVTLCKPEPDLFHCRLSCAVLRLFLTDIVIHTKLTYACRNVLTSNFRDVSSANCLPIQTKYINRVGYVKKMIHSVYRQIMLWNQHHPSSKKHIAYAHRKLKKNTNRF